MPKSKNKILLLKRLLVKEQCIRHTSQKTVAMKQVKFWGHRSYQRYFSSKEWKARKIEFIIAMISELNLLHSFYLFSIENGKKKLSIRLGSLRGFTQMTGSFLSHSFHRKTYNEQVLFSTWKLSLSFDLSLASTALAFIDSSWGIGRLYLWRWQKLRKLK